MNGIEAKAGLGVNVHVYPSTFEFESRMDRAGRALVGAGLFSEVVFVGVWRLGLEEWELGESGVEICRLRGRLNSDRQNLLYRLLRFLEWSGLILGRFRGEKLSCINCHSLSAFPACVVLRFLTGARLIYDAHELETETESMRGGRKWLAKLVEWVCIHEADAHVFVSDSIANWYRDRFGLRRVYVVRNVPLQSKRNEGDVGKDLRRIFGIGGNALVCLHQGRLEAGRGVERMLDAFTGLPERCHLVLLGFGELVGWIREKAAQCSNIHYHEPVSPDELPSLTQGADLGLHLIGDTCLNHLFCLPNKLFEYTHAGVPVVFSDLPEVDRVVTGYGCGWTVKDSTENLREKILEIDGEDLKRAKEGCQKVAEECNWEREREVMLGIYSGLGFVSNGG